MGVAAEVLEYGFRAGERWLDMDVPVEVAQGCQVGSKGFVIGEFLMVSEEVETMLRGGSGATARAASVRKRRESTLCGNR